MFRLKNKNFTSNNSRSGALAVAAVAAAIALSSIPVRAQTTTSAPVVSTLPGGASSLNETYKDWQVTCVSQGASKRCTITQTLTQQQNGQRVLAVELIPSGNTVSGTLLLPFGLALDKGVTLQIDDKPVSQPWRFRTCVPAGCVVALSFETSTIAALRTGTALKLKAVSDDGNDVPLSISLSGFGAAIDRATTLAK